MDGKSQKGADCLPKKSVYRAKPTRKGGVSWPEDKATRCLWQPHHWPSMSLPIIPFTFTLRPSTSLRCFSPLPFRSFNQLFMLFNALRALYSTLLTLLVLSRPFLMGTVTKNCDDRCSRTALEIISR